MKKRIITLFLVVTTVATALVGCAKKAPAEETQTETAVEVETQEADVEEEQEESSEEVSEVKGIVEAVKDFMIIVTDKEEVSYAFTFEEKPEGVDAIAAGDEVIVKYTGTISEIDPFVGEVLSVEKVQ